MTCAGLRASHRRYDLTGNVEHALVLVAPAMSAGARVPGLWTCLVIMADACAAGSSTVARFAVYPRYNRGARLQRVPAIDTGRAHGYNHDQFFAPGRAYS